MIEKAKALSLPGFSSPTLPSYSVAHALICKMFSPPSPTSTSSTANKKARITDSPFMPPSSTASSHFGARLIRGSRYTNLDLAKVQRNLQWSS